MTSIKNLKKLDAVAGPDGEDATLLSKPFEHLKIATELWNEQRKIIIGLTDASINSSYSFIYRIINRIMISVLYQANTVLAGKI